LARFLVLRKIAFPFSFPCQLLPSALLALSAALRAGFTPAFALHQDHLRAALTSFNQRPLANPDNRTWYFDESFTPFH